MSTGKSQFNAQRRNARVWFPHQHSSRVIPGVPVGRVVLKQKARASHPLALCCGAAQSVISSIGGSTAEAASQPAVTIARSIDRSKRGILRAMGGFGCDSYTYGIDGGSDQSGAVARSFSFFFGAKCLRPFSNYFK